MKATVLTLVFALFVTASLAACAGEASAPPAGEPSAVAASSSGAVTEPVSVEPKTEPSGATTGTTSGEPETEPSEAPTEPASGEPETEPSEASSEDDTAAGESPSLPYIPAAFDMNEEYPPLLYLEEAAAYSAIEQSYGNYTLDSATFYVDEALFTRIPTEDKGVLAFGSSPDSAVGECVISIFGDPVTSLDVLVSADEAGEVIEQVPTLNLALDAYLKSADIEVVSYYSDRLGEMYVPGVMGYLPRSFGLLFFFTDGSYVYSLQLSVLDTTYADAQRQVVSDLLMSLAFEAE